MLKMRKIPMRTCVITREKLPKIELLRIVRTTDNSVIIDKSGKINGRGAYIKKDLSVLDKAIKSKALEKHLEVVVPNTIYEEIKKIINNM